MFKKPANTDLNYLDLAIRDVFLEMKVVNDASDEKYAVLLDRLVTLHSLKEDKSKGKVSADVRATIIANLAGIGAIIFHERAHVISTKALSFVQKLR